MRICIILLLLISTINLRGASDTLTNGEKHAMNIAYRNSCFGQFELADSCSRAGDSVAAGYYLMRINPYYLFFEKQTPETLDSYLVRNFLVPAEVRKKYIDSFTSVYHKPRTAAYNAFEQMHREDQYMRNITDTSMDIKTRMSSVKRMQYTDSLHFVFLMKYIHKYGWPSIENGSIYAATIAIHDHYHHREYLSIIKGAVLKGMVDLGVLKLFISWLELDKPFQTDLAKYRSMRFDVTPLLKNEIPESLPMIKKAIAEHCPVRWKFVQEIGNDRTIESSTTDFLLGLYGDANFEMVKSMDIDNCRDSTPMREVVHTQDGLWSQHTMKSNRDTTQYFLYLFYGEEIKYNDLDVLFADSSFATHAIYFENNSAELIHDETYVFLNKLMQWLKSNPNIKIEISGHTDNVGKLNDNIILSKARADAVRSYLIREGIDAQRITAKGYGDKQPIAPNTTEEGRGYNRRVELRKL